MQSEPKKVHFGGRWKRLPGQPVGGGTPAGGQPFPALFAGQTRLWSATEHGLDPQIARQMLGILELIHEAQYVERAVKVIPPDRHQPEAFTGTPEPDSEWESKA